MLKSPFSTLARKYPIGIGPLYSAIRFGRRIVNHFVDKTHKRVLPTDTIGEQLREAFLHRRDFSELERSLAFLYLQSDIGKSKYFVNHYSTEAMVWVTSGSDHLKYDDFLKICSAMTRRVCLDVQVLGMYKPELDKIQCPQEVLLTDLVNHMRWIDQKTYFIREFGPFARNMLELQADMDRAKRTENADTILRIYNRTKEFTFDAALE